MAELIANRATTTLNGAINNAVTSLTVTSAATFPATGDFRILIDEEILLVTAVSTNTFTVTRGAESTSAASHLNGATVAHILTVESLENVINQEIDVHASDTSTHGVTGAVVGTSDTQTLTNKTIVVGSNTITTAASGNLAATELNAALAELQTDIDTRATSSALTTHTGASTGVHGISGAVVGTTDSQTLTNKIIVAANNTITTAASGNLAATNLNSALAELQTDIDTRATSSALTSHTAASTGVHGVTGSVVGTSDSQTVTNKVIQASLNTITELDRAGTLANIPKTGLTEGMIYRGTDPALHSLRWNGTYWQTLSRGNEIPLEDGLTHLSTPTYRWTATGAGTNEYACELAAGGNPSLTQPASLYLNDAEVSSGTPGSLAAGTWGWGTYSGFNTVHVRLADGSDPDSQMYGYVKADSLNWVGGAGTATALIQSGVPLMSVNSGGGTNTLRTRMKAVTGTWTFFATVSIVPSFTGTSGAGIAVSDGTKFRSLCVITDTTFTRLKLRAVNWSTNTTGFTDLGIDFPLEYIMSHGSITLAAVDNGTNVQFFAGAHNSFMRNVYQVSRLTHVTPTMVGPCVYTNNDIGRAWFPQLRLQ